MPMNSYVAFKACEDFHTKNERWPGTNDVENVMLKVVPTILQEVDPTLDGNELVEKAVREM
jgi:hypothetical protein